MSPPTGQKTSSLARIMFGDNAPPLPPSSSSRSQASAKVACLVQRTRGRLGGVSASSSTPTAEEEIANIPTSKTTVVFVQVPRSEIDGSGSGSGTGADTNTGTDATGDVVADADHEVIDLDGNEEENGGCGKRAKKCTSDVWQYFTKKTEILEVDGKKYYQLWGHCNFPGCRTKYRAECNYGTTGFRNHLKSAHRIVKGQQQLIIDRIHGKDITVLEPYKYDQDEGDQPIEVEDGEEEDGTPADTHEDFYLSSPVVGWFMSRECVGIPG
ncbi:hypothetical protein EJB05_11395, partial [Eragrostis curvula]